MKTLNGSVVYLSGPMTGYPDFNRARFDEVADELRETGFDVIVPGEGESYELWEMELMELSARKRQFYLLRDVQSILSQADFVVVLEGWEDSEGARLEVLVAQAVGVPVFQMPTLQILREGVVTTDVRGTA